MSQLAGSPFRKPFMKTKISSLIASALLLGGALLVFGLGTKSLMGDDSSDRTVVRAAFDIGSDNTKLVVARVDPVTGRVVDVLFPREGIKAEEKASRREVPYVKVLPEEHDFSAPHVQELVRNGINAINELKELATPFKPVGFQAVATSAFRNSGALGQAVVQQITRETGVPIRIISDHEEGILGFQASAAVSNADPRDILLWDIGSSDVQFAMLDIDPVTKQKNLITNEVPLGAVHFAEYLVDPQDPRDGLHKSPNPINSNESKEGMEYVHRICEQVRPEFLAKIHNPKTVVVGIGGVHYFSIRDQVMKDGQHSYTAGEVLNTLDKELNKTDEQIGGPFASTQVSNLVLVEGFMKALDIKQVRPCKTCLANAVVADPRYWSQTTTFAAD